MNAKKAKKTGLGLMREPFPANQIGKLPKPTKKQTEEVKADYKKGIRCAICKGWHHPKVVHLDYVGHAALTDRLLDVDPGWTWEPLALRDGLPAFDITGGLWIKLTILGVTRLGYGSASESQYKDVGSREKECIGDALRNAAMRFGAALDLWHKGDLHDDTKGEDKPDENPVLVPKRSDANNRLKKCETEDEWRKVCDDFEKRYGQNAYYQLTGHNDIETYYDLFQQRLDKIKGKPPFDANENTTDLQKDFDSVVKVVDSYAALDNLTEMVSKYAALDTPENQKALDEAKTDLVEKFGEV